MFADVHNGGEAPTPRRGCSSLQRKEVFLNIQNNSRATIESGSQNCAEFCSIRHNKAFRAHLANENSHFRRLNISIPAISQNPLPRNTLETPHKNHIYPENKFSSLRQTSMPTRALILTPEILRRHESLLEAPVTVQTTA